MAQVMTPYDAGMYRCNHCDEYFPSQEAENRGGRPFHSCGYQAKTKKRKSVERKRSMVESRLKARVVT